MPSATISARSQLLAEVCQITSPPPRTTGVFSDLVAFFFHRPEISTLIPTRTPEAREEYSQRILQRLPISVDNYTVLNIHQIGVDAPVKVIYEELVRWTGESPCWPNHIATVESIDGSRRHIRILGLGGWTQWLRNTVKSISADFGMLFRLSALKFQSRPDPADFDNARFLLYECSGGYPIGIFCVYVRSPVKSLGETEHTQVFFAVSFNFFGMEGGLASRLLHRVWRRVHNRVTANVMNRFKQLCEANFQDFIVRGQLG